MNNNDIRITRPDKGRATSIISTQEYNTKMAVILEDTSKFVQLGPISTHDNTVRVEKKLNSFLKRLKESKQISEEEFFKMRPIGSVRPRLYGLPKIHKANCPLRPILSMVASPQYNISKWLCGWLDIVQKFYCKHTVKDTFEFIDVLRSHPVPASAHMCSFDVVSLFTNVLLEETINICLDVLYRNDEVDTPWISETAFRELMLLVTTGVELSFSDIMYREVDGVAMGSPLGPVLANVFVGYCESLIAEQLWPALYVRFVDDSFTWFDSLEDSQICLGILNDLHPSIRFTCEHEQANKLPFLDVLVEKSSQGTVTSVYRKPTFTGQYIMFDSYCSYQYKVNLVRNLVDRANRICSSSKLAEELDFLKSVFLKNGYPDDHLKELRSERPHRKEIRFGPDKCPTYLSLPWKGNLSLSMSRVVRKIVQQTYYAVHFVPVFTTVRAFRPPKKPLSEPSLAQLPSTAVVPPLPVSRAVEMDNVHIVTNVITQCTITTQESTPQQHPAQDQSGRRGEVIMVMPPSPSLPLPPPEPPPASAIGSAGAESVVSLARTNMDEVITEHEQEERGLKETEFNRENNTINIQRPRRSTANYSMNYYSTGCQAPAKTLGTEDLATTGTTTMTTTTMVTNYHQDQRRSQRTEVQQREASLGPIGGDEENDTEDDTEDELEDETGDEVAVGGDEESDGDCVRKKSAAFLHLLSHPKCLQVYDDFSFSVLCRARYASQLKYLRLFLFVCISLIFVSRRNM